MNIAQRGTIKHAGRQTIFKALRCVGGIMLILVVVVSDSSSRHIPPLQVFFVSVRCFFVSPSVRDISRVAYSHMSHCQRV